MGKNYIVDGNLDHNQIKFKTGDIINLEDEHADPLLAIGRIKPAEDQPAAPVQPDVAPGQNAAEEPQSQPVQPVAQPQVEQSQNVDQPVQPEQPQSGQPSPEEIANLASQIQ